jgi:hypothetical protein
LDPVARLCQDEGVSILGVRHAVKANFTGKAIHSGQGNVSMTALARSGLLVDYHPDDDSGVEDANRRRVIALSKTNIAPKRTGLAYKLRLAQVNVMTRSGKTQKDTYPAIEWLGTTPVTADQMANQSVNMPGDRAKRLLKEVLSMGPVPANEVFGAAEGEGITQGTLRYQAQKLGVLRQKEKTERGKWWWALPDHLLELAQTTGQMPLEWDEPTHDED